MWQHSFFLFLLVKNNRKRNKKTKSKNIIWIWEKYCSKLFIKCLYNYNFSFASRKWSSFFIRILISTFLFISSTMLSQISVSIFFFARRCWKKMKVRKTQEGGGGWIVFSFSSFSPIEVTGQKQLDYSFWSDVQILKCSG